MNIQRKIAEYCMLKGAQIINEDLNEALNHIVMAKYCLLNDFEETHKLNILIHSQHVDKWMSEWYLETIKHELKNEL